MSHPEQLQFVKSIASGTGIEQKIRDLKVIEIGSYDVNGSIRKLLPSQYYTGVDLIQGPGVDLVSEGGAVDHPDNTYHLSISCECFEHNPQWSQTFHNMWRMTQPGGGVLFTCATTGRPEHGTTRTTPEQSPGTISQNWDYYQNLTEEDFRKAFNLDELFSCYFFMVNPRSKDLYFFGHKAGANPSFKPADQELQKKCEQDQKILYDLMVSRKKKEKLIPKPIRPLTRLLFDRPSDYNKNNIINF